MSSDLQWLLLRKSNSFLVKRVTEGPVFSREAGNLTNLHSHKFSGLANAKTVDIAPSAAGVSITTRKKSASPYVVKKAYVHTSIRARSGDRRAAGVTAKIVAKKGYRPDLRTAALARTSAILASYKEKKVAPPKKVRGGKATTA
ncbi:hypothetical protein PHLGIDRAFT_109972 [Phlebiopsis gigantea 11061_1 CR5-6]|uniref:Ribosomal eL28/Mak16 domain-containing protein n=1 Tax=Phlebiopsis gigantea (strain 11061_1 CR5-6) TaxID=745531 RepID=A0A0C3NH82_PHLG1|nr:hypothetical protein PHLGIDRAFT_109972 [Phlebiopsis gigantea 11061_1 CR5-6]